MHHRSQRKKSAPTPFQKACKHPDLHQHSTDQSTPNYTPKWPVALHFIHNNIKPVKPISDPSLEKTWDALVEDYGSIC